MTAESFDCRRTGARVAAIFRRSEIEAFAGIELRITTILGGRQYMDMVCLAVVASLLAARESASMLALNRIAAK